MEKYFYYLCQHFNLWRFICTNWTTCTHCTVLKFINCEWFLVPSIPCIEEWRPIVSCLDQNTKYAFRWWSSINSYAQDTNFGMIWIVEIVFINEGLLARYWKTWLQNRLFLSLAHCNDIIFCKVTICRHICKV